MIAILKYNAGNIQSVHNALDRLGLGSIVTDNIEELQSADKVIIPGVGEASSAMKYLRERGLDSIIKSLKQPVLGICLGLQLMCLYSDEGCTKCLGIFDASVKKFPPFDKVPHMGWNNFTAFKGNLFKGVNITDDVYYVHSYYAEITSYTAAICDYVLPFSAAMHKDNFYAVQFHPEKSADTGIRILKNFFRPMRIIVALDILDGKCVRLRKGDFSTIRVYNENPVEFAKQVEDHGIKYIHLVDLDGAKNKRIVNYGILEKITLKTEVLVDFGGGIRSSDDLKIAFNSGANQVTSGSISLTNPGLFLEWLNEWGPDKIILGADCKNRKIASEGWTKDSDSDIIKFIGDYLHKGVKYTICTDIEKDGMMQGPSTDLYKEILDLPGINLIASGGISSLKEIEELSDTGCEGAIIGKALYEGIINLKELSRLC